MTYVAKVSGAVALLWAALATPEPAVAAGGAEPDSGPEIGGKIGAKIEVELPPLPAGEHRPDIFVQALVDREAVYVGEQATVTWILYTRHELVEFAPNVPRMDDFWTEILYEPITFVRQSEALVDGVRYQVSVVSKRALFPLRSGRLRIAPYMAVATSLYTPLGARSEVRSQALELEVRPLPTDGVPAGFDDAYVGLFRVHASVDRNRVSAGEPLILTLAVRGHGAIRRTRPPEVQIPGFEVERAPDFRESMQSTERTALGERVYRYWLTPARAGTHTIPPIDVPYFDPRTGAYEHARSWPIEIAVANAAGHGPPRAVLAGMAGRAGGSTGEQRWWLPAGIIALSLALVGFGWYLRARSLAQRRLAGAHGRLRRAEQLLAQDDAAHHFDAFFGELAEGLEDSLGDYLGAPVRGLARARVLALLRERGLGESLVGRIHAQFDECDLARFASSAGDAREMGDALARVRALIGDIAGSA